MTIPLTVNDVMNGAPIPPSSMRLACSAPTRGRFRWRVTLADTGGLLRSEYVVLATSEQSAIRIVEDQIFPFDAELVIGAHRTDVG